jgi:hypothetical protein
MAVVIAIPAEGPSFGILLSSK